VKAAAGQEVTNLAIGHCARDHTMGGNRVDTSADDCVEIWPERENGNRQ
jgi:hypothetical protein